MWFLLCTGAWNSVNEPLELQGPMNKCSFSTFSSCNSTKTKAKLSLDFLWNLFLCSQQFTCRRGLALWHFYRVKRNDCCCFNFLRPHFPCMRTWHLPPTTLGGFSYLVRSSYEGHRVLRLCQVCSCLELMINFTRYQWQKKADTVRRNDKARSIGVWISGGLKIQRGGKKHIMESQTWTGLSSFYDRQHWIRKSLCFAPPICWRQYQTHLGCVHKCQNLIIIFSLSQWKTGMSDTQPLSWHPTIQRVYSPEVYYSEFCPSTLQLPWLLEALK